MAMGAFRRSNTERQCQGNFLHGLETGRMGSGFQVVDSLEAQNKVEHKAQHYDGEEHAVLGHQNVPELGVEQVLGENVGQSVASVSQSRHIGDK